MQLEPAGLGDSAGSADLPEPADLDEPGREAGPAGLAAPLRVALGAHQALWPLAARDAQSRSGARAFRCELLQKPLLPECLVSLHPSLPARPLADAHSAL